MKVMPIIYDKDACAIIIDGAVHIMKRSCGDYSLYIKQREIVSLKYCCQDSCCDAGLKDDVLLLVEKAKELLGVSKVFIKTGQGNNKCSHIAGLPVECVSRHEGKIDENFFIFGGSEEITTDKTVVGKLFARRI